MIKTVFLFLCIVVVFSKTNYAQSVVISGYVKNNINRAGIESVNIFERNTEIGTITNRDGYFKLFLKGGEKEIRFTINGFEEHSQKISVARDTSMVVFMQPSAVGESSKTDSLTTPIKTTWKSIKGLFAKH